MELCPFWVKVQRSHMTCHTVRLTPPKSCFPMFLPHLSHYHLGFMMPYPEVDQFWEKAWFLRSLLSCIFTQCSRSGHKLCCVELYPSPCPLYRISCITLVQVQFGAFQVYNRLNEIYSPMVNWEDWTFEHPSTWKLLIATMWLFKAKAILC